MGHAGTCAVASLSTFPGRGGKAGPGRRARERRAEGSLVWMGDPGLLAITQNACVMK